MLEKDNPFVVMKQLLIDLNVAAATVFGFRKRDPFASEPEALCLCDRREIGYCWRLAQMKSRKFAGANEMSFSIIDPDLRLFDDAFYSVRSDLHAGKYKYDHKLMDKTRGRLPELIASTEPVWHARATPFAPSPRTESVAPEWNRDTRILTFRGVVLRSWEREAPRLFPILDACQTAGWPQWPARIQVTIQASALGDAITNLNRDLPAGTIRFRRDGTGRGVGWEQVEATAQAENVTTPEFAKYGAGSALGR